MSETETGDLNGRINSMANAIYAEIQSDKYEGDPALIYTDVLMALEAVTDRLELDRETNKYPKSRGEEARRGRLQVVDDES